MSLITYKMFEGGNKIEFYDKRSMTCYMVVRAIRWNMPRAKEHDMGGEEQGRFTTKDIQFST